MWQRIVFSALLLSVAAVPDHALAQTTRGRLVSQMLVRRYGLERAWFTQVVLDPARARLTHVTHHVSSLRALTVHEISHDEGRLILSERALDSFGVMLGKEGSQKAADEAVAELQAAGLNPKLTTRAIPEITLFVTTSRGLVQAIDGETGRARWTVPVGRQDYITTEIGVNEEYVAVINGSTLYVLDRDTGKLEWQRRAIGIPGAGPALSNEFVFTPTVGGALEALLLRDHRTMPSLYKFGGHALIQPTVSERSVAWTTDRGHLYVANANRPGVRYRLETKGEISCAPAFLSPNRLLVASIDGDLYCVHEMSGDVMWRFSTGQPIEQSPVVVGNAIYLNTNDGDLYRVSADAGIEQWWLPRIRRFVAASRKRVYCVGDAGRLMVFDAESGGRIGELPTEAFDVSLTNSLTDRVFIASSSGLIQCLHEIELEWPLVHAAGEDGPPQTAKEEGVEPETVGNAR